MGSDFKQTARITLRAKSPVTTLETQKGAAEFNGNHFLAYALGTKKQISVGKLIVF
jgi:hypothetical protein